MAKSYKLEVDISCCSEGSRKWKKLGNPKKLVNFMKIGDPKI